MRRGDDRAVTVQIGAVLLLAILFAALALYQINVVPAENADVEFTHNQAVQNELQELRNAVRNVGVNGGSQSSSVTLGTQYPTRTFSINPPAPTGTLETTEPATVSIANATYVGSPDEYRGDPSNLTGTDHETTTVVYEPDYNEHQQAPTTRVEHGFAYNEFEGANVSVTDQGLVSDGTIRLVLLDGSLSETRSGVKSIDIETLSGPSDEIPIIETSGNITLTLPTESPQAWEQQIGATFDVGESNAKVAKTHDDAVEIELAEKPDGNYRLQMARVGIGESGVPDETLDVDRVSPEGGSGDGSTGTEGAYAVEWDTDSMSRENEGLSCSTTCTFNATASEDTATAIATTTVEQSVIDYAVGDTDIASIDPHTTTTRDGRHESTLVAHANGNTTVFASSGGTGTPIEMTIRIDSSRSGTLPDGAVAYHDENDNGDYDDEEPTYTADDLGNVDISGSLIVADDATRPNGIDLSAGSLTVENGVQLATEYNQIQLASEGQLTVAGTLDTTSGAGQGISIETGDSGQMDISGGTVRSSGQIDINSGGTLIASNAQIDATAASFGSITVSGADLSLDGTTARTEGPITVTATGPFDAPDAIFESTGEWEPIELESSGDMILDRAVLDGGGNGDLTGQLNQGGNDLYVADAEFRQHNTEGTFDYSPNGVDVIGEPAYGSTS